MAPNLSRELNITKFILRASLLSLAVLVAVAFVLVRRDSIVGRDASVSDQTKTQPFWLGNGRDRTESPSTRESY
tara:strand:- start:1088 stop:1309 length:222 start_codon:yes stop_codon:yes gene_type:complete